MGRHRLHDEGTGDWRYVRISEALDGLRQLPYRVWGRNLLILTFLALLALGLWMAIDSMPKAQAEPTTTDEVCTAFNLGVPPDQIVEGLERGDGRMNYWQAQRDTVWPIIEGECG